MKPNQKENLRAAIARAGGYDIGPLCPQFLITAAGATTIETSAGIVREKHFHGFDMATPFLIFSASNPNIPEKLQPLCHKGAN